MKKSNMDNPYSFCTFNQSDLFYSDNTIENENSIITDIPNEDEQTYLYEHYGILQEYCYTNGNTNLYNKFGNDKLALLYERSQDKNKTTNVLIYNCNMCYISTLKSDYFDIISYTDAKDFMFIENVLSITSKLPIVRRVGNSLCNKYSSNHLNSILVNGQFISTSKNKLLADDFRKTYMRYNMATNLIPAQCTIKEILKIIHKYIVTGKLDETNLLTNYIHLQNFAQMCSGTITQLADFISNPSCIDLRNLCDFLNKKIHNIENLINMYLSNELEKDSRSK